MYKFWIVTKNELMRYFISPLAYVYLTAFLILNATFAFYFGHFFERGQASLEPMFWYQPWLYLLFIPGISMRMWAEEFRQKTIVQIMTMPVSTEALVWGKFLASWIFCALALALTFPFWITVNLLGSPDNTVILISYIGSLFLAGCMLAISQTMSALTKNQVIALVLSVIANLVFFWSGIEFILSFFRLFLPDYMIDTIASFSFLTHFSTISRGLFELRDLLFFVSIIVLFNFTTVLIVGLRTAGTASWLKSSNRTFYVWAWLMLMLGFMGFNLLANNLTRGTQVDFSEDQIFTLSRDTKKILQNLPEPVTAKLYYSPILEKRNPVMRQMFDKIRLLLEQYKTNANGRFDYRIYHPQNLDNIEDRAIGDGIQPIPLIDLNKNALFGMTISDTLLNKQVIELFTAERMPFLEQDLTSKIYQLSHHKKTAAIISSLPINGQGGSDSMIFQPWEISRKIDEFYNLRYISSPEDFAERPDVLILIHPMNLSPEMVEAIKTYSRDYGNILLLLDAAAEALRLYSTSNHPFKPSNLNGLDTFWGIKFYNQYVVADLENSITVDATSNYQTNPAFTQDVIQFKLKKENFNPHHAVTKNLHNLLMSSVSIILPENEQNDFIPLLQASQNSALMPISVVYDGLNPRRILTYFKADKNPKILAAAVHGRQPDNQFNLIAVADSDFIYDRFWTSPQTILEQTYYVPLFNNADFILNSLDYLTNNTDLIGLRGKRARDRSFSDIESKRKNNVFQYKIKEDQIFNQIEETKQQLQEIWNKKSFEERETFNPDELALISGMRKKLDNLRRELSMIKIKSNQDIEKIGAVVKFTNIFGLPLLLALGLILLVRVRRTPGKSKPTFNFNRQLTRLSFAAAAVLLTGILSVYVVSRSDISQYEGKPLFPQLPENINEIEKIVIKSHQHELVFVRENGIWKLQNQPEFVVYQERIRSFLSALIESRYYEKKSNRAENLHLFGLMPIESENSSNTRIELFKNEEKSYLSFEVGDYNLDLGRGSRAAYIKFDSQFQVWLAETDLIDLSTDWHAWTYSTLWNLRFGRLESYNQQNNPDKVAEMVKILLNTPFISAKSDNHFSTRSTKDKTAPAETSKEIFQLSLKSENNNNILLKFYQDGNEYYVQYTFEQPLTGHHLELFAQSAQKLLYQISSSDWEKIIHAASGE